MEKIKLLFFGDSELSAKEPIIYFPINKVVCDYSDCGLYVASKYAEKHKPIYTNLQKLIKVLSDFYDTETIELFAYNNGIAKFFNENNLKTLNDLINYFSKLLNCKYP